MDDTPPSKPPSARRQNRIAAMQFLYMCESNDPQDIGDALRMFFGNQEKDRDFYSFGEELAHGAWEKHEKVDEVIREYARNWSFDRIAKVDLAILRLAIYELNFRLDIPPIVTINEAIDLAKDFSDPDARRFINGILDRFKETLHRPLRSAATE
ncbi:transcription antitermination factor NusB [Cerasicoccus arenae]|uniref:Transcription antitermination protein NusB n=1 Tax=Cerasicoccus arenae TaxID=424488 RepID=A0A8J3D6U1_9BACT|nr:transcription antitermination factor NusB [Cerasicoccus arenae]MBK1858338.1 transcription antitermination factor NusB [Cerasicoccus arenae]GHB90870.1 N utilization substance protein B [Cerasicoccus arenae]